MEFKSSLIFTHFSFFINRSDEKETEDEICPEEMENF